MNILERAFKKQGKTRHIILSSKSPLFLVSLLIFEFAERSLCLRQHLLDFEEKLLNKIAKKIQNKLAEKKILLSICLKKKKNALMFCFYCYYFVH